MYSSRKIVPCLPVSVGRRSLTSVGTLFQATQLPSVITTWEVYFSFRESQLSNPNSNGHHQVNLGGTMCDQGCCQILLDWSWEHALKGLHLLGYVNGWDLLLSLQPLYGICLGCACITFYFRAYAIKKTVFFFFCVCGEVFTIIFFNYISQQKNYLHLQMRRLIGETYC